MRELILVRHAKSDWGDPAIADHDRPLNARGRRNAPMMAQRLASTSVEVRRIISSTALRARTTAAEFGAALGVEVELDGDLYLASASRLLATAAAANVPAILLVAHDPGLSDLAFQLSGGGIEHMPSCAIARFRWDDDTRALQVPADSWTFDTPRSTGA